MPGECFCLSSPKKTYFLCVLLGTSRVPTWQWAHNSNNKYKTCWRNTDWPNSCSDETRSLQLLVWPWASAKWDLEWFATQHSGGVYSDVGLTSGWRRTVNLLCLEVVSVKRNITNIGRKVLNCTFSVFSSCQVLSKSQSKLINKLFSHLAKNIFFVIACWSRVINFLTTQHTSPEVILPALLTRAPP